MRSFTVGFAVALVAFLWTGSNVAISLSVLSCASVVFLRLFSRNLRLLMAGFGVGALLGYISVYVQLQHQLHPDSGKTDVSIVGTVISVPKHDSRRSSFLFRIDSYDNDHDVRLISNRPIRIRLNWYGGMRKSAAAGDQWRLVARLKPSASLGNSGGFNYERWLFHNRIHATGYVRDSPPPVRIRQRLSSVHAIRESIAQRILNLPSSNEQASLVQGLTVGVTNKISETQWQTLRLSGTAHLLAISGLHIGLVGGWIYFAAGFVWRVFHRVGYLSSRQWCTKRVFALSLGFVGATVYAALAGFSLPTQRALIMLGVFALSVMLRRNWPPGSAILLALLLVLLLEPLSVLSVGFWLSFGTVSALFYLHSGWVTRLGPKTGALLLHLKLGIVLLPATAWFFQQGSLIAPVANAIAVPVVGLLVVPLSFAIALLTSVWPYGANLLLVANQWVLAKLLALLDWLLTVPVSNLPLFLPGPLVLVCALVGLLVLFSPRALRLRWMSVALIAPAILLNVFGKPVRGIELHVLDVGQGLSAVLLTENHTVLFDTGKRISDATTMFDRVVVPFLVSHGRAQIDVAVISHGDDDHAGGIEPLRAQYPGTHLYVSAEEHLHEPNTQACLAGETFVFDDVTFSFIHPAGNDLGGSNNLSCVLLVHYGNARILLTGDIESEAEQVLIDRIGTTLPLSALIAPHHGSRSSSTEAFVSLLPANIVIFAAGENNAFGFPHADVVDRYLKSGSKLFTTGESGALRLHFDKQGLASPVKWYWHNRRRYRRESDDQKVIKPMDANN